MPSEAPGAAGEEPWAVSFERRADRDIELDKKLRQRVERGDELPSLTQDQPPQVELVGASDELVDRSQLVLADLPERPRQVQGGNRDAQRGRDYGGVLLLEAGAELGVEAKEILGPEGRLGGKRRDRAVDVAERRPHSLQPGSASASSCSRSSRC